MDSVKNTSAYKNIPISVSLLHIKQYANLINNKRRALSDRQSTKKEPMHTPIVKA